MSIPTLSRTGAEEKGRGGGRVETAENQCFFYLMMTNHKHKNFPAILLIEAKKLEDNLGYPWHYSRHPPGRVLIDTRQ